MPESKVYILDKHGNKIGSSEDEQIHQSVIVDIYGQPIPIGDLVFNNVPISKYSDIEGFYKLNDLHTSVRNTWMAPNENAWRRLSPARWYRKSKTGESLSNYFDEMAGWSKIDRYPNLDSGQELTSDTLDIPEYLRFDMLGNLNIESNDICVQKPYPIKVINGGPNGGVYGPILTVLKYAAWISPALDLHIHSMYNRMCSFTGDFTQLLTESKISGTKRSQYHSVEEANFKFGNKHTIDSMVLGVGDHPYAIRVVENVVTGGHIQLYHDDIWWSVYNITPDKW